MAQTNCQSILTNARNAAAKGNYKEAIDKYTSAVDCDPNLSTTANNEIKAMFDKINKLKDDAIKAKNEVVKQKQIAQTQAENAKKAEEKAQKAQKQAEVEKQTALTAQKQAEIEKQNAEQANKKLKKTIAQVVLLQLQQVDKAILNLSYDTALVITNRIADLDELPDSTLKHYQEIAYWYNETNQTSKAISVLQQAAQHLEQPQYAFNFTQLSTHIQQLNPQHYQQLQKRYYPEMLAIKGGSYTMGSHSKELGRDDDETQHLTKVSDFKIACTETTVFQFALYCQANYGTDSIDIRDFLKDATEKNDARHPVATVSWYNAISYANWLSQRQQQQVVYQIHKQNKTFNNNNSDDCIKCIVDIDTTVQGYRLPTEAEWEYACRAGTTTPFNTGNNLNTDQANYNGNYAYAKFPKGQNRGRTTPVATFPPNDWGVYDMHGNVWEWCHDWYGFYLSKPPANYSSSVYGWNRVLRGGSWYNLALHCRSAYRDYNAVNYHSNNIGFRLVFIPHFKC